MADEHSHLLVNHDSITICKDEKNHIESFGDHNGVLRKLNLKPLDGLRGLSSALIVIGHFLTLWVHGPRGSTSDANGTEQTIYLVPVFGVDFFTPVSLFFLLSGFTLVQVYDRPSSAANEYEEPLRSWASRRLFFRKRIARLAPMYYFGLLLGLAPLLAYYSPPQVYVDLGVGLFWLQSLSVPFGIEWNGPLWTVSAFAICYLVFPPLLLRFRSRSLKTLGWLSALVGLIAVAMPVAWLWFVPFPALLFCHFSIIFRLPQFVLGMLAGLLAKRITRFRNHSSWLADICSAILGANLIFHGLTLKPAPIANVLPMASNVLMFYAEYVLGPVLTVWILALTDPECKGVTKWLLNTWPAQQLGKVSYSMYCLHFPLFNWIAWAVAWKGLTRDAVPIYQSFGWYFFEVWAVVPVFIVVLGFSSLAYWLIENRARFALTKNVNASATS